MGEMCNVCGNDFKSPVYESAGDVSITSLNELYPGKTYVYFCEHCGHVQTREIDNIEDFYAFAYKILIASEEEDQIYKVENGEKIFRIDHQMKTLVDKLVIPQNAKVMEYGCAKAATLRKLLSERPDLDPYVFDVSEMYVPFWEKFLPRGHWATFETPADWEGQFDTVISFFALEHVAEPKKMLAHVQSLLKPGGVFYAVFPNFMVNLADLIVVDHVNHFTRDSLRYLAAQSGFELLEIDDVTHDGGFVYQLRKPVAVPAGQAPVTPPAIAPLTETVQKLSGYWQGLSNHLQAFEQHHTTEPEVAIYGSGFYGTFIATCLKNFDKVACFLDQNPFKHGQSLMEKPIVPPEALPSHIKTVYVGLRPNVARDAIGAVDALREKELEFYYL